MMSNPFNPQLFLTKSITTAPDNWTYFSTWIHKQPFFMWCIALSFKLFGVNIVALRLPSILITSSMVFPVFKLGKEIKNELSGFLAVTLLVFNHYINTLHNGSLPTDHNDLFFMSIICWAFYFAHKHTQSQKTKHLILTAALCGLAVLTKWLVGLLPLGFIWIYNLIKQPKELKQNLKIITSSLGIAGIIFIPWQLHCYINFNEMFLHEMNYNSLHIKQVVEGHGGGLMHHLAILKKFFGYNHLLLIALILGGLWFIKDKFTSVSFALITIVTHLFFAIVKTKMDNFTLILMPVYLVLVCSIIAFALEKYVLNLNKSRVMLGLLAALLIILGFKPKRIPHLVNIPFENYIADYERNYHYFKNLAQGLNNDKSTIVFNCFPISHPIILLYSNAEAYSFTPDSATVTNLKSGGYNVLFANYK